MQKLTGLVTALFLSDNAAGTIIGTAPEAAEVGNLLRMESTILFHVTFPERNLNTAVSRSPDL
jgi:hypothetical protein